ncbi:uncharacterized protein ColSpa_02683 [Colletotrichum spaethianum]|uniref:Transmembrane protein n=1 Tax=Colletotrichum spaethianum TaxID=700344 RepID=A0AA37NUV2_9PEZI|nr:uncharacterized protein ColSpa_02683 [Colletotrichum spaethianum]GKT42502.1 hypothetical protein ColSpa_02683 [Colletotrichum spaethianum]
MCAKLKRKKQGQKFRLGRVFGHALLVSTGLWIPVFLYKKFVSHKKNKSGNNDSGARGGVYAKIEEGRADDASNRDSWYAGAAAGTGNNNNNNNTAESKYEPMGYAPYRAQTPVPPYAPRRCPIRRQRRARPAPLRSITYRSRLRIPRRRSTRLSTAKDGYYVELPERRKGAHALDDVMKCFCFAVT